MKELLKKYDYFVKDEVVGKQASAKRRKKKLSFSVINF